MRFVARTVINAIICYLILFICLFIVMAQMRMANVIGYLLQSVITLIFLYIVNKGLNKAENLNLSVGGSLWSITSGILILGIYLLGRELLVELASEYGILGGFSLSFAINCLIMLILSIPLNMIFERSDEEFRKIKR